MRAKKNKKEPIKKVNERLSQELVTERKIISQLRNSLEVMDAGWSLDKTKLTQALEKLNKLEVCFNKNDKEYNSEKNIMNTVKLKRRENMIRRVREGDFNKSKITTGLLNNKMCDEDASDYKAMPLKKIKIYKVLSELERGICEEDKCDSDERLMPKLKVNDVPDDTTSMKKEINEETENDDLMAQGKTDCDITMKNDSHR